ncbi:unnamed protein product [Rotaria sp. Silwood2]|nr:unnamed protein product [Rotaria sp. Silwood2]CAF3919202.1 unnamed protein product [Rotaria sp. Silwood2]CAF4444639.1 unnamed protein product [Rotaria sp. Silwood2]
MTDQQRCQDLHSIKVVADDSHRRRQQPNNIINNTWTWNNYKDVKFYIPQNYNYNFFDYTFFWNLNNTFDYFGSNASTAQTTQSGPDRAATAASSDSPRILWIDKKNNDSSNVEKQLSGDKHVKIDFFEKFSQAEDHLLRNKDKIKSSSKLQIICRGYYKDENKNPLNLLHLLNQHNLKYVPILVFTQDKSGLNHHLQKQAPSMGIDDWKQRLFITSSSEELVTKIKENISNKPHQSRR